jgi:hypothetical protein
MSLRASELRKASLDLIDVDVREAEGCAEFCEHIRAARSDPLGRADEQRSFPVEPEGTT